jgi:hypothetical protein
MCTQIKKKPTSNHGVSIVKSIRFNDIKNTIPGAGTYAQSSFLVETKTKCTSTRETLNTRASRSFDKIHLTKV